MNMMQKTAFKIHILYKFSEGPWGGGNQFLKALRGYFRQTGVYSESPEEAEVILLNGHQRLDDAYKIKRKYPGKIVLHRLGPVFQLARGDKALDRLISQFNRLFADGTIFQSGWSREKALALGMQPPGYEAVIINAPDPAIFNLKNKKPFDGSKVKLIATSWSGNVRKGFDIYQFLDEHLDFSKYEMTFVGNSPVGFKNIKMVEPVPSRRVAGLLKEHDIFISASSNDACSNAIVEALHCGLPAVARNDGGNPEIIRRAGELFEDGQGAIAAIERVARGYPHYQQQIDLPSLDEVGAAYLQFAQRIYEDYLNGNYYPKKTTPLDIAKIKTKILKRAILSKLQSLI